MTIAEKIEMYKGKKAFVSAVSKAFEAYSAKTGVESVAYEVYRKTDDNRDYFIEYLVITFVGGGKSVRSANGNSLNANFSEIGKLIDGGYYEEIRAYNALTEEGFVRVV
jgi:hypothetical protein